jgi:hypothetical protein
VTKTIIRPYSESDLDAIIRLHRQSGLPDVCLPDLSNPLFCVKVCAERRNKVVQAGFVKIVGEAYLLVDHEVASPQERLDIVERLVATGLAEAASRGFEDVTAWLPPKVRRSFAPRLTALGFIKSPWQSYTALLG